MTKKRITDPAVAEALSRARSVSVGTCFGGVTEISMRRNDGTNTFAILQPVEVIELIHQLSANVGCHLYLAPRRDFAAWRDWKYTAEELAHYRGNQPLPGVGWPPFVNDMAPFDQLGANLPPPEAQPGMTAQLEGPEHGETVAVEAPKQRRKSKRAAGTS